MHHRWKIGLEGRVALTTGGARIGEARWRIPLRRAAASLALIYRGLRDAAEMTAVAARAVGAPATVLPADSTDENQIEAAVPQTANLRGRLDNSSRRPRLDLKLGERRSSI